MTIWYPSHITTPSVAGVLCSFVRGSVPTLRKQTSEDWHRPGIAGRAIFLHGFDSVDTEFRAILLATDAEVDAWFYSLRYAVNVSPIVAVRTDRGDYSARVFVRELGNLEKTVARRDDLSVTTRGEVTIKATVLP